MITFSCRQCGKRFSVGEHLAGREGRCKSCGGPIFVPDASDRPSNPQTEESVPRRPPTPPPATAKRTTRSPVTASQSASQSNARSGTKLHIPPLPSDAKVKRADGGVQPGAHGRFSGLPVRLRRLHAEADQVRNAFANFPAIRVQSAVGNPPEVYRIEYFVRGLAKGPSGDPIYRNQHLVEIQLTSEYPRQSPKCRMLTPVFHPNIEPASICVGDHWTAGERLIDLIVRIGEMITFQAYNVKSPLDGEAAMWADQNDASLPVDNRDLSPPEP